MHKIIIFILKALRKIYAKTIGVQTLQKPICDHDPDSVSLKIYNTLMADEPCMIARFGSTELTCLINYIGVNNQIKNYIKYIKGNAPPWWWEMHIINQMQQWSGFFPPTKVKLKQFCKLMLDDIPAMDILGSWLANEKHFKNSSKAEKVHLRLLEPFWSKIPWTNALKEKKILVVHPFADVMINQYKKKDLLFKNKSILPDFGSLTGIKAVQSLGKADNRFEDWFEALEYMKNLIDNCDYDVCLIGAGAYGFPLAAHVKRSGKKAVHLGGALQLLFGIRGKRWDNPNYGVDAWGIPKGSYSNLINDHWVRPGDNLKPENADNVEGACYW